MSECKKGEYKLKCFSEIISYFYETLEFVFFASISKLRLKRSQVYALKYENDFLIFLLLFD